MNKLRLRYLEGSEQEASARSSSLVKVRIISSWIDPEDDDLEVAHEDAAEGGDDGEAVMEACWDGCR